MTTTRPTFAIWPAQPPAVPAAIHCLICGAVSYHPHDVDERYCGRCHTFHDDLAVERALVALRKAWR